MANYSYFQIRAKGEKRNVLLFAYTLPVSDTITIVKQIEKGKDYILIFKGCTNWALNTYLDKAIKLKTVKSDQYISDNGELIKTDFIYNSLEDKAKAWKLELDVFEEYEDYDPVSNSGDLPSYKRIKNGKVLEDNNYTLKEISFLLQDILKEKEMLDTTFDYANSVNYSYDETFVNELKLKRKSGKQFKYYEHYWLWLFDNNSSAESFMDSWAYYIDANNQSHSLLSMIKDNSSLHVGLDYDEGKHLLWLNPAGHPTTAQEELDFAKKKAEMKSCMYIMIAMPDSDTFYPACITYNLGEGIKQTIIHDSDYELGDIDNDYALSVSYSPIRKPESIECISKKLKLENETEQNNISKFSW